MHYLLNHLQLINLQTFNSYFFCMLKHKMFVCNDRNYVFTVYLYRTILMIVEKKFSNFMSLKHMSMEYDFIYFKNSNLFADTKKRHLFFVINPPQNKHMPIVYYISTYIITYRSTFFSNSIRNICK